MEHKLFRKVSLERISSPEQLNQYIRVSNPSVWLVLAAVMILLVSACVWGIMGRLETTLLVKAVVRDKEALCFLTETQYSQVKDGMTIRIGGAAGMISQLPDAPSSYESLCTDVKEYELYSVGVTEGSWHYPVKTVVELPDGVYDAQIVTDSVSPLSFLIN